MSDEPQSLPIKLLLLVRYLYRRGESALRERGPFSAGFAISCFQDAAETFLRAVAEHFHCPIKDITPFLQLLDAIDSKLDEPLTHRASLNRLNRARVNFKHFGLMPSPDEADKFRIELDAFINTSTQRIFNVDFGNISMACLIGHTRTENWLRRAERSISEGNARDAVESSAKAFAIFRRHMTPERRSFELDPFHKFKERDVVELARNTSDAMDGLQAQIDLLFEGIDVVGLQRFRNLSPGVMISQAGTIHIHWSPHRRAEITIDDARRCVEFVTESAIRIKENRVSENPGWRSDSSAKQYRVVEDAPIIVYPENEPEVIRIARAGEMIIGCDATQKKDDHVAVYIDGLDRGYISSASLEEIL